MPTRSHAAYRRLIHLQARSKPADCCLAKCAESIDGHETFALESTLSGKTYVRIFERALSSGYDLELHYLWLSHVEQAIARVRRSHGRAQRSNRRHPPSIQAQPQSLSL